MEMTRVVLTVTVVAAGIVSAVHAVTGARAHMGVTEGANRHRSSSLRDFSRCSLYNHSVLLNPTVERSSSLVER